ncbi:hypothetical protein L2E82_36182 [Cichorium intybus]|uniref:Uncharacterized protein n=1 Tax=Cichorium intybus TaxID=13427 RepID=A0ACB9BQU5_CICIN|nr:hypothetical protein L2E82_36182 [Cichorium intybus]
MSVLKQMVEHYSEHYQTPFPSLFPATSEGMPWSFHNLIELHVERIQKTLTSNVKKIIKDVFFMMTECLFLRLAVIREYTIPLVNTHLSILQSLVNTHIPCVSVEYTISSVNTLPDAWSNDSKVEICCSSQYQRDEEEGIDQK